MTVIPYIQSMNYIKSLHILKKRSWNEFETALRSVNLMGDPLIYPYKNATITSKVVSLRSIYPVALYVLKKQLDIQKELHTVLLRDHGIDMFDLDHGYPDFTFRVEGEDGEWSMAPPIIEKSGNDGGKRLLLDGEHRFITAREMKRNQIRVVLIENIPKEYPVVALPVHWSDVAVYGHVPQVTKKRQFRFTKLSDFPDVSQFSKVPITKENFHYFFYRDLSPVCSSGIRKSA